MLNHSRESISSNSPEKKRLDWRRRLSIKMAMLLLALVTATSAAGCAENPVIGGISGPDVKPNGLGAPDVFDPWKLENLDVVNRDKDGNPTSYIDHMANMIDVVKINDGRIAVLDENADVRTSPIVGDKNDGTKTTIVTVGESVPLSGVNEYLYLDRGDSGDSYYGFFVNQAQSSLPNVDLVDYDGNKDTGKVDANQLIWVNSSEVSFEDNSNK